MVVVTGQEEMIWGIAEIEGWRIVIVRSVEARVFGLVVFKDESDGGKESEEDCVCSHESDRVLLEGFGLGNASAIIHV